MRRKAAENKKNALEKGGREIYFVSTTRKQQLNAIYQKNRIYFTFSLK